MRAWFRFDTVKSERRGQRFHFATALTEIQLPDELSSHSYESRLLLLGEIARVCAGLHQLRVRKPEKRGIIFATREPVKGGKPGKPGRIRPGAGGSPVPTSPRYKIASLY